MSHSTQLTHDQSEPHYGWVIGGIILTFVVLLLIVCFSILFYDVTVSHSRDYKDQYYVQSQLSVFDAEQNRELSRLQYRGEPIKLPIELAKKAVILEYSK
jgi:hypothetical protein